MIQYKEGKIVSVTTRESVPTKKEITKVELEAWKDKLGDGITFVTSLDDDTPTKIDDTLVKGFINLAYHDEERSHVVIGEKVYSWDKEY